MYLRFCGARDKFILHCQTDDGNADEISPLGSSNVNATGMFLF